jgi:peptide deformylase
MNSAVIAICNILLFNVMFSVTHIARADESPPAYSTLTATEVQLLQERLQHQRTDVLTTALAQHQQILKSPSRPIVPTAPYIGELITQMRHTLLANRGIGLTAVQIGIPVRVVLLYRKFNDIGQFQVFFNPKIINHSLEQDRYLERSLSLPYVTKQLTMRPVRLTVHYQNTQGQNSIETLTAQEAAILQQNIELLNGILLTDQHSS